MNQSPHPSDRRQHPRFKGNIPLKISSADFDIVTETKNLSRNGAYCQVDKYIEPMTKLKIHLLLPFKRESKTVTKKITCQGIVVRTEANPGQEGFNVAIYFSEIQDRGADCISEFILAACSDKTPAF